MMYAHTMHTPCRPTSRPLVCGGEISLMYLAHVHGAVADGHPAAMPAIVRPTMNMATCDEGVPEDEEDGCHLGVAAQRPQALEMCDWMTAPTMAPPRKLLNDNKRFV